MTGQRLQLTAVVHSNHQICREHYRLVLRLPSFPQAVPGQFVQIACHPVDGDEFEPRELSWSDDRWPGPLDLDLASSTPMLRRPFSLAGRRDTFAGVELEIIHRVVGRGSQYLSLVQVGEEVSLIGPLGNGFTLPSVGQDAILVGGGVGIPPMIHLAAALAGRPAVAFAGAVTADLMPLQINETDADPLIPAFRVGEFARHGIPSVLSTDDGSTGFRGFITQALERYLDRLSLQSSALSPVIYTCGPELMMKRVGAIALERGIECQVAVERAMACGMGTCQSCCIKVKKPDPSQPPLPGSDWCYRLACTDGPVFRAEELLW